MRGFWIGLTYKIEKLFQKISERREHKECIKCGDCEECSITGVCTIELNRARCSDEIKIED